MPIISPERHIIALPADELEKFAREWAMLKTGYYEVDRFSGAGDSHTGEISLDLAFKKVVSRRTNKQIADVLAALGLDQGDPARFVKGFVLLSMVVLGVGIVGFSPTTNKIARWTSAHDELLFLLMQHFQRGGLKESQAIRAIATDPMLENWFPYRSTPP